MYYVCLAYHFTLKSEIIDQMLREDFRVFVDVENITYWEEVGQYDWQNSLLDFTC